MDEGTSVTLSGSFLDPLDNETQTFDWHVVSSSFQPIADGYGQNFTFTPGNAGTYTVTFTVTGADHGSGSGSVTINSTDLPPQLTAPTSAQTGIAGESQSINLGTVQLTGVGPFTDTVEWGDGQTSKIPLSASGPISLAHTYATGGDYKITETVSESFGGSATSSFSIDVIAMAPTSTTLSSSKPSAVYGQSVTFTATVTGTIAPTGTVTFFSGANPIGTGSLSVVNNQDVATFTTCALSVLASPYTITAEYGGDANDLGSTSNPVYQTITPYAFTYTIANDAQTYGTAANLSRDLAATINTGINGQTLDIAYASTGDTTTANVGTYAITGTLSNGSGAASNYTVTLNNGTLTVNPYAFAYAIANDRQTYGTAANLSRDLASTINTGVNGQNLDIAYTSTGDTSTANVGSYAITGTLSNGTGLASNYTVTLTSGSLTVNKYAFVYAIANDSQTYGTAANLATALGTTISTGVNGQNLDIAYASAGNTTTANVGSYAITGTLSNGSGLTSNYTVTLTSGSLTVNKYAFAYTIANDSQTYGTAANLAKDLGTTINTGVNGQNLDIAYSSTGDTTSAKVGTYPITATLSNGSGLTSNYTVTVSNGTLTVKPAALTITSNNASKTYGTVATFSSAAFTETGLVTANGDTITGVTETSTGSPATATVGTYSIVPGAATGSGLSNYTISYVDGTLTVAALNWSSYGTIYILDPTAGGALDLSGSASVNVTGNVIVDSSSSSAIEVSGAAAVKAAGIQLVGGVQKSGSPTFSPQPVTGIQVVADPLAGLAMPAIPAGLTNYGSKSVSGSSSATLQPGIYSQISVSGAAKATLAAGTYVIQGGGLTASGSGTVSIAAGTSIILEGGGLSVSGAAAVSGTGVTIFNFGTAYNGTTDGGTFGPITLSGSGSVSLTPTTSGTYAGILIFQGRDNTKALTFSGAAMQGVTGMIYAPAAQLAESGSASLAARPTRFQWSSTR